MQFMTFRLPLYLLAGIVILLFCLDTEALPTKKKAPHTTHKQLSLKAHSTAKQCPIKRTHVNHHAATSRSKLHKRSTLTHPSAKSPMVLFHGTRTVENVISLSAKVDLTKTHSAGDFHKKKKGGADGGAYFTDSLASAAQYACFSTKYDTTIALPQVVYVASFHWTPGNFKVHEFSTKSEVVAEISDKFDMITGPMVAGFIDDYLTPDFWQYAVVKQEAVAGLKYLNNYKIYCNNIEEKSDLSQDRYQQGQYGNAGFDTLVTELTSESRC